MGRKRNPEPEGDPFAAPGWMCTYADLNSLLLCFFILLFAFSTLDSRKIKEVLFSLQTALGVFEGGDRALKMGSEYDTVPTDATKSGKTRFGLEDAKKKVQKALGGMGLSRKIGVRKGAEGVILTFPDSVLFLPGSDQLTVEGIESLGKLNQILKGFTSKIRVDGHTDNVPADETAGTRFRSNWELCTARALSVLHWLIDSGGFPEKNVSVAGYSGNYPAPGGDNSTYIGRRKNRRVEIVLLAETPEPPSQGQGSAEIMPRPNDADLITNDEPL
jgi:chemotaxis protein MotB